MLNKVGYSSSNLSGNRLEYILNRGFIPLRDTAFSNNKVVE